MCTLRDVEGDSRTTWRSRPEWRRHTGQDQFYILATSKATERTAVLKHDDTFAVFDYSGDIGAFGAGEQGLYHEDTRYLSRFRLRLNGRRPLLLSARVKEDNELFGADLTNPDIPLDEDHVLAHDLVHLFRARFLWEATWHERIRLWNYSRGPVHVSLTFDVDADFADIFEVRGTPRERGARGSSRCFVIRPCVWATADSMAKNAGRSSSGATRPQPERLVSYGSSTTWRLARQSRCRSRFDASDRSDR
jgi:glycogen debranching enzyme